MNRELSDWTDLLYAPGGRIAHIVPYGGAAALCGCYPGWEEWRGTGSMDEHDHARSMPVCPECAAGMRPR